jgi:Fe-S-cluster containining protein
MNGHDTLKRFRGSCAQCGSCCKCFAIIIEEKDIQRWEKEDRKDILKKCNLDIHDGWLRSTGEEYCKCPWLKKDKITNKFYCKIHDTKPDICKNFPVRADQLKYVKCKGYGWVSILAE